MKTTRTFLLGVLIGLLGIILFSSKAVMVKLAYAYDIDALSMLLLRMAFSFPFYVGVLFFSKKGDASDKPSFNHWIWLICFGFVGYYLASYFDFVGLVYIKASLERIILFVYPTIVILLNKLFLKQTITKIQIIAIAITYIGIVITFGSEVAVSGEKSFIGGFFVLLSAVTYASYLVGSGWLIPKFGVTRFTSYAMMVSCICVFIHYGLSSNISIYDHPWQVYVLGFLIAIFATVIPSFLVSQSITMISSSNFAVIAGAGPISTIILASLFLSERLTILQVLGAIIVIVGIVLVSLKKEKKI